MFDPQSLPDGGSHLGGGTSLEEQPLSLWPGAGCTYRGDFCAFLHLFPSGLGVCQVPRCPLFIHGLALYGRAVCS